MSVEGFSEYDVLGRRVVAGSAVPAASAAIKQLLLGFGPVPARRPSGAEQAATPHALPRYELSLRDDVWYVNGDAGPLHADRDFVVALRMLEWHLMSSALEGHDGLFHLHGASLLAPGKHGAVVLVGKSGSGKSTLTLALMQRGFLPFADDVALIDPATLQVRALRRAFHLDEDSRRLVEAFTGQPVRSGGEAAPGFFHPPEWATAPVPVHWVLLLELAANQPPVLTPLPPQAVAATVLEQSLNLKRAPQVGLAAAAKLTADAECYRFQHGPLAESVGMVERLVG